MELIDKAFIKELKSTILAGRYKAAKLANRELLILYLKVGGLLSHRAAEEAWGSKVLNQLSVQLQVELPGLRGFSASNLKRMRILFETWITKLPSKEIFSQIGPSLTDQLAFSEFEIGPSLTDQFQKAFYSISFTHHYEIISKTDQLEERIFYITKIAKESWSVRTLKYHLKSKLYQTQGTLPNNFEQTLPQEIKMKAINAFRDNYLLDFIQLNDPDDEDERFVENEIVKNIKQFLLSLGSDFTYIGNQYRLIVDGDEFFIDLLFFNRSLQSLVAIDLKSGKSKPEYISKMNFYLSALNDMVKLPHEKPSIGIILCREKNNKVVEYTCQDFNKAMGVATYETSSELPPEYQKYLPDPNTLRKLME